MIRTKQPARRDVDPIRPAVQQAHAARASVADAAQARQRERDEALDRRREEERRMRDVRERRNWRDSAALAAFRSFAGCHMDPEKAAHEAYRYARAFMRERAAANHREATLGRFDDSADHHDEGSGLR